MIRDIDSTLVQLISDEEAGELLGVDAYCDVSSQRLSLRLLNAV